MFGQHESGGEGDMSSCTKLTTPKRQDVIEVLKQSQLSADLKWSLFRAASECYKFDSLLKPFPKTYLNDRGEKMIVQLRALAEKLDSIPRLHDRLDTMPVDTEHEELIDLMRWVFFEGIKPKLTVVPKTDYAQILKSVSGRINTLPLPTYMFRVDHPSAVFTTNFNKLAETYGTRLGFHGSRLENFVSILNYGLQVSMMKVGAFGPGVYLSSELSVSLQYSPHGLSWSGSAFGGLLSIVALCEMISHPAVRCRDENGRSCSGLSFGGEHGPVPNKYFIVENSELVRIRYLLVYGRNVRGGVNFDVSGLLSSSRRIGKLVVVYFIVLICFFGLRFLYSHFFDGPK